ncbi:hypothetical protein Glove_8g104 [Diversispora epigaea]|uniref:Uncharacterized protein n=1 Tax=Diversispora epigaea TaxID=1348612 RepID=A0A397JXS6_9GLOM|nr:hypothetical protein Glove_8g104 [Diversispora epigaea]
MEIDFEEKLEKSQENINQMKEEIDFLANINQQFGAENDQLIKNLDRFRKYRIPESISIYAKSILYIEVKKVPSYVYLQSKNKSGCPGDSGTESEIIPSKRPKGRKLKSKKIVKTNKRKRVFGNDSEEEDTKSDDEKNEKGAKNEMKTIIKTIDSEFSLNYDQTFTSANNCEIRHKLIPELQKSLAPKFRPSVTQLTKWLNSIHKSRRATARMCNSGKLLKDLRRVHANNRQNDKKIRRIKAAKELFRKNNPNITDYNKESLLRMLADRAFHSPEIVNISSLKEKYNIRLPRLYKEQTSAPQTVHFSEELESTIPETVDELKTATARMCNSGKLLKDLRRVHANNRQNDKKIRRIKAAKELFRKNNPNITDYNKESLLRMLADRAFHSPEMSDTNEEDRSKTVVNVYDLSWRSAEVSIYF